MSRRQRNRKGFSDKVSEHIPQNFPSLAERIKQIEKAFNFRRHIIPFLTLPTR